MKPRLILLVVLCAVACRRSTLIPHPTPTLMGTVVENPGCGHYIVQILSGSFADSNVVPRWTDPVTGSTFANVFTVKDWILMDQAGMNTGDTFSFTLNGPLPDSLTNKIYFTCMMVPYTMPAVSNDVTNIQKQP